MKDEKYPDADTMMRRSRRIKEFVREALEEYPQGRGDDMLLFLYVLKKHYGIRFLSRTRVIIDFGTWSHFFRLPSYETVRRRRQEFQSRQRELLPTERVQAKRALLEEAYRQEFGQKQLPNWW